MITVHTKKTDYPRKDSEYAVVLMEQGKQLTCVLPFTPYESQARLVQEAFTVLLETGAGQDFAKAMIAELP